MFRARAIVMFGSALAGLGEVTPSTDEASAWLRVHFPGDWKSGDLAAAVDIVQTKLCYEGRAPLGHDCASISPGRHSKCFANGRTLKGKKQSTM